MIYNLEFNRIADNCEVSRHILMYKGNQVGACNTAIRRHCVTVQL